MTQNPLYVFVHVPRTGGARFAQNVVNSFPLNPPRVLETDFDLSRVHKLVEGLSTEQKENIRFIKGHYCYKGIDNSFGRSAKYITILREPIARAVSTYNHFRSIYEAHKRFEKELSQRVKETLIFLEKFLVLNGEVASFDSWVEFLMDQPENYLYQDYYSYLGYFPRGETASITLEKIESYLSFFHYVGITGESNDDFLYLYHQLGVKQFYSSKNRSKGSVDQHSISPTTLRRLEEKLRIDFMIYEIAKKKRLEFKDKERDYFPIVAQMKRKRALVFPIQATRRAMIDFVKKCLGQYTPLINRILYRLRLKRKFFYSIHEDQ